MKSEVMLADCRHLTGYHEFRVFDDETESQPLLAVRAGVPITEAMAVAESIFECVAEFEYEILQRGPQNQLSTWASRWLLTIAEALVVSAQKGTLGALKK